ncbi:MAG: carboxypeptidase regulatory-like domain-containing protein [Elusimicrobiales bacterium]|nr:carboxypeptidase regulatory-like domain-containing protein [Elusimicrobiales bacterium]
MSSFTKIILAAVLFAASSGLVSAAPPTLKVHIQKSDLSPVQYVTVAAIEFGMNGPSTYTQVGLTDIGGDVTFTLSSGTYGRSYNLYYSSHGFSPSISDQFNNPEYDPNRYVWAMGSQAYFSTFTITQLAPSEVGGRLIQQFIGASTGTVLFGGVYNMVSQMQGGSGIVLTNSVAGSTDTLVVDNVPFADANTYNIGLYDPKKNKGIGRNVMTALSAGTPVIAYLAASNAALNFDQSVPPARVETKTQQGGEPTAGASVEGVLMSTNSTPIGYMGLEVKGCGGSYNWQTWAHADQNGRFQLYGLTPGVTYYVNAMGGCTWNNDTHESKCYAPFSSPNYKLNDMCTGVDNSLATPNDIVYSVANSSEVIYKIITLDEMPRSIGQIRVYVRSTSGVPMPNSNVNINPDGSPWPNNPTSCQSTNFFNNYSSSAGYSNLNVNTSATGYALLDGLPSGNYTLNVNTPFSNNSGGPSAPFNGNGDDFTAFGMNGGGPGMDWTQAHCSGTGKNDYRITIDTDPVTNGGQTFHIYNSSGSHVQFAAGGAIVTDGSGVNMSSITYIVEAGAINMSGLVRGTLRFPGITDLSNNPVTISVFPQCMNMGPGSSCPPGNLYSEVRSGASSYDYSINVSSGYSYYMNVTASGWGRVNRGGGNNNINLASTGTAVVDMDFVPAGSISGTVYKPGGTEIFTPSSNQWVWIDANSNNGWTGTQLQKDGTFAMNDVLPGVNRIRINVSGGGPGVTTFNYALPNPAPSVMVTANSSTTLNLNLVKANYVGVDVFISSLPARSMMKTGRETVLGFKVIPLPSGTVLKGETIAKMLTGGDEEEMRMNYSSATLPGDETGRCGSPWPGGFCAMSFPSPAVYDFYLMRAGDMGKGEGASADSPYPHFTLISSSKNVVIDDAHAKGLVRPGQGVGLSSGVVVNLTPSTNQHDRGNATLAGRVTAANFFRKTDYEATGGDFENFVKYLPVLSLYDANGVFAAAGVVLPPPDYIATHDLNNDFQTKYAESYEAFSALLGGSPTGYGFEIRALAPSTCYTAVLTTPNYPPYQEKVCMGVNGSTKTVTTINMDTAVGAGATLSGVVTTTGTPVKLANAEIQISGEGVDTRSVVTSSVGYYKFEGLPEGAVRIKVSLSGYSASEAEESLVGHNTYTQNFALFPADGSITGTVYSQKLPFSKVQPGAIIVAYDDTYNVNNPTKPLPLMKTMTGSDGTYKLENLIAGDVYKVFLKVPGKYTLNQTTTAAAGIVAGVDFTMLAKPLDLEIFAKKVGDDATGSYEFTVLNPQDFKQGEARWAPQTGFSFGAATVLNLEKLSSGELRGSIPLSSLASNITYILQGNATSYSNKTVSRQILFGKAYKGSAEQHIDDTILGDDSDDGFGRKSNEAPMDKSGDDASALMFPAGAVQVISSGAIPTCSFKGEGKDSPAVADKVAALGADAFAGNLYTVDMTSAVINTGKEIELTLAYDKSTSNLNDLSVSQYNDTTAKWEQVPGVATINPVKGTVKVKLKKLASVLSRPNGYVSVSDGRQYVVRPQSGGSSSSAGTFAVVRPSIAGNAFAGKKIKVFNYPNPFNLKDKAISNNNGAALPGTVNGTVIHVEVPAGNGGAGHVKIYTLSGELVKDIKVDFTDGAYNYVGWDGHNAGGQEVANGVYYGVVEMSGKSVKREDATFKMAVIK